MTTEFRRRLSGAASSALARRLVEQALRTWRLTHRLDDALIVTTELVENVFKHTSDGGQLKVRLRPGALVIEVADDSPELPERRVPGRDGFGGRGIRMVEAIAARWGAKPTAKGKVVWAELDIAG
jgi:anti-sigma regulatory factor (Ser/Thr protein kinase)